MWNTNLLINVTLRVHLKHQERRATNAVITLDISTRIFENSSLCVHIWPWKLLDGLRWHTATEPVTSATAATTVQTDCGPMCHLLEQYVEQTTHPLPERDQMFQIFLPSCQVGVSCRPGVVGYIRAAGQPGQQGGGLWLLRTATVVSWALSREITAKTRINKWNNITNAAACI